MIICFEGPSAVGKTHLCELLHDSFTIVPEVNLLFSREEEASKFWYYEKQVERYQMALQSPQDTILDGDVFQPLWYNWAYGFPAKFPSFRETQRFYLKQIRTQHIAFPDIYMVFQAPESLLRKRKEGDSTRKRRNFEKHLQLIHPQRRYFEFLQQHTEIRVVFMPETTAEERVQMLKQLMDSKSNGVRDPIKCFQILSNWLSKEKP